MRLGPILLVEDDPLSLKLMRDVLNARGYETLEATNGVAGLALAGATPGPALVVLDIGLPGIDGCEVTRRLRSGMATASLPILAVTAYAMRGDEERMREAGCDGFLTKPLSFTDFVAAVESLVNAT